MPQTRRCFCTGVVPQQFEMAAVRYQLPAARIATAPASPRGSSRLLQVQPGRRLRDGWFAELPELLPAGATLVMNNSRVVPGRLFGRIDPGESVELMLLYPERSLPHRALAEPWPRQQWRAMLRCQPAAGTQIRLADGVAAEVVSVHGRWDEPGEPAGTEVTVRITEAPGEPTPGGESLAALLVRIGTIPIPPYLGREANDDDPEDYQTVYASEHRNGSVAAPTAGLHFTPELLDRLRQDGVQTCHLALHVSAGTFKPVEADCVSSHQMHRESFSVDVSELSRIAESHEQGRPVMAVGTTSIRVSESLYWLGVRELVGQQQPLELGQWEHVAIRKQLNEIPSVRQSYEALADRASEDGLVSGSTSLCCVPGYEFMVCTGGLITNFHQPDSTLMLLVAGYLGSPKRPDDGVQAVRAVYKHALEGEYSFLSYGDACLFHGQPRD